MSPSWMKKCIFYVCTLFLCGIVPLPAAAQDTLELFSEETTWEFSSPSENLQEDMGLSWDEQGETEDSSFASLPQEEGSQSSSFSGSPSAESALSSYDLDNEEDDTELPDSKEEMGNSYTVTLSSCTIGNGQTLSYTTISSAFADGSLPEGYYPGELTVEISGQIIIEAGGTLAIGPLSIGGPEASPVLSFSGGQIIVKSGGSLQLTETVFATDGTTPLIVQETGGSIELQMTQAPEGLIQWAPPLVDNLYQSPDDLWLPEGTLLQQAMLPSSLEVDVQLQGQVTQEQMSLSWNLEEYDGRSTGELVLTGTFLDETGQTVPSRIPLELTIHWYKSNSLQVTKAVWKGETVPVVQLTVLELPEEADIWGEVSTDNGKTWERWETEDLFFIVENEPEGFVCNFALPDETPRMFRIAAQDWFEPLFWQSEAFSLTAPTTDDSSGNRGGSTTPVSPEREPSSVAPPEVAAGAPYENSTSVPESSSSQEETSSGTVSEKETSPQKGSEIKEEEPGSIQNGEESSEVPSASTEPEEASPQTTAPQKLSKGMQILLVILGIVFCVSIGIVFSRLITKKKEN